MMAFNHSSIALQFAGSWFDKLRGLQLEYFKITQLNW